MHKPSGLTEDSPRSSQNRCEELVAMRRYCFRAHVPRRLAYLRWG